MDRDLIDRIRGAAHVPAAEFDVETVVRRGRQRRRWRRTGQATAAVLTLIAVGFGVTLLPRGPDRGTIVATPPPSAASPDVEKTASPDATRKARDQTKTHGVNVLVPKTYSEGDRVVMPVTIPDGTTAEIVYPKGLDLAGIGVRPYASAVFPGCCGGDVLGDVWLPGAGGVGEGESYFEQYGPPIGRFEDADGRAVRQWAAPPDFSGGGPASFLVFRYGHYQLPVGFLKSAHNREIAQWAKHLGGRVTEDGFLVLSMEPPLRLQQQDAPGAAWLEFGGFPGLPQITVAPTRECDSTEPRYEEGGRNDALILCQNSVSLQAQGRPDFVRALSRGVQIRNVHLAGD